MVIADDDELFRSYLSVMLAPVGLETITAANGNELTQLIQRQMPDCIILDYDMTNENGIFVQEQLRARFPSLCPILMLSADETQRTAIRAFRMGVDDFVQKRNLKLEEIQSAISRAIFGRRSRRASDAAEPGARGGSSIDHVTGLYTREEIDARILRIEAIAERSGHTAALFAIYFEPWQSLCHRVGLTMAEMAMREFARKLGPALRVGDICGRYGEDVLCCVWENCADLAVVEQRKGAMKAALNYTYNVGAAQFDVSARILAEIRSPGGEPFAQRLAQMSAHFDANRQANLVRESALDASGERPPGGSPFEIERRRTARRRVFKKGTIAINEGASRLPVNVRNLSEGGAKIELLSVLAVPDSFTLLLNDFEGPRKVRKRWQTNEFIGLEFVE